MLGQVVFFYCCMGAFATHASENISIRKYSCDFSYLHYSCCIRCNLYFKKYGR